MQLNHNFNELAEKWGKHLTPDDIRDVMEKTGTFVEDNAKNIINEFRDRKGHTQGVDSGNFRDGIHSEVIYDGFGFRTYDTVPYGKYHEFGTERHFVPFFDDSGALTSLGQWAMRHFDDLGFEVIKANGKRAKKPNRQSRKEVLRKRGGIMVQLDEMAPFRKSIDASVDEAERRMKEKLK